MKIYLDGTMVLFNDTCASKYTSETILLLELTFVTVFDLCTFSQSQKTWVWIQHTYLPLLFITQGLNDRTLANDHMRDMKHLRYVSFLKCPIHSKPNLHYK